MTLEKLPEVMEPAIAVTQRALDHYLELVTQKAEQPASPLRLYLDGKGCDGFYYGVCFDRKEPGDLSLAFDSLELLVDAETLKYVKGSTIDFIDDDRGRGFLVENPNQKKFRGKFFKRRDWEKSIET